MASEHAIETAGLGKRYGSLAALTEVDLVVERGTIFSLIGPNGAGKTTLVRILSTLTTPDAGSAVVSGFDVVAERREVRRIISLTGQYAAVDGLQTGKENLVMMARLSGLRRSEARARARQLLEQFDLGGVADRRVATYSGGTRRRLDLAAGLTGWPKIIFLDEPTTGVDVRGRQVIWSAISELASLGITVFLTTQYLEEADKLAHRIAMIDDGQIVAQGTAAELKESVAAQRLDLVLVDSEAFDDARRRLGHRVVHCDATTLTVGAVTDGTASDVRAVLDEIDPTQTAVKQFIVVTATLEDVFLQLTDPTSPSSQGASIG